MRTSILAAFAASLASASAQALQGFNYGSVFTNGAPITQQDYEREFNTAKQLQGTSGGFTSARLFTIIQVCRSFTLAPRGQKSPDTVS